MKFQKAAALCVLIAIAAAMHVRPLAAADAGTAYSRVMTSHILRCGHLVWPPYVTKDLNTGKLGGIYYDLTEQVAKALGLKVEWALEYPLGTQVEALKTGKIDALCGDGPWTRSAMPFLAYSHPLFFIPVYAYVGKGGRLANSSLDRLNAADVTVSQMDGDISQDIAAIYFPNAKPFSLPSTADPVLLMENVAEGKADLLVEDSMTVFSYNKGRKSPLVPVGTQKPLAVYPNVISTLPEEVELIALLDRGIDFLTDTGIAGRIVRLYDPDGKNFFMPHDRYK